MSNDPQQPNDSPYNELLQVALRAAAAGGEKLMEWRGKFSTREKAPCDLVTDADVAAQRAIAEVVNGAFPQHAFLGEEEGGHRQPEDFAQLLSEPFCWVVDPLDGTMNYVHGYPAYAVSIGVVAKGKIVAGVIFDPLRQRVYSATLGGGAWCNGKRLAVSETPDLASALLSMSLPAKVDCGTPDLVDFMAVVEHCQSVRRLGSAALNLAFLAEGALDGFWARQIQPWDVAAGVLLVTEAGGHVTASDAGPFDLANPHFVAANHRGIHAELLARLANPAVPASKSP